MGLNFDIVGKPGKPSDYTYTWKDTVLYALGVGAKADELEFVFEGMGPKVLPTFAVVPSFISLIGAIGSTEADLRMVLHGEQSILLHRPIPPSGTLTTVATVTGIYDKGKGALAIIECNTANSAGEALFDTVWSIFIRGAGGFGGERGPEAAKAEPPDRPPDFEMTETTSEEQALLYRLSGDLNPLHADPALASAVGFERPILHGLCSYGFAGRAVIKHACGGDPARLKSFGARFAGIVLPGSSLTTRGWDMGDGTFVVAVTEGDRTVIKNSIAKVAPA